MLTVKQLCEIVVKAEGIKEKSWEKKGNFGKYTKTNTQVLQEAAKELKLSTNKVEEEIGDDILDNRWNDVQLWLEDPEINK